MSKFKVGDIIVGREGSNTYCVTSKENDFVGRIIEIDTKCIDDKTIRVEVIKCKDKDYIGYRYWVDPNKFELKVTKKKKIYLASPFFNDEELVRMVKVLGTLRNKNLEVFSPYEHQNKHLEFGSMEWRKETYKGDIRGIECADVVVAIVSNGNYSDSGTAFEIGYATAKGIPVVVVNLSDKEINLMISDSLKVYLSSIEELEEYDFNTMEEKPYTEYVW